MSKPILGLPGRVPPPPPLPALPVAASQTFDTAVEAIVAAQKADRVAVDAYGAREIVRALVAVGLLRFA